jgi:hypothetical protein
VLNQIKAFTFALALTLCVSGCAAVRCSEVEPGFEACSAQPAHFWNQPERFVYWHDNKDERHVETFVDGGSSSIFTSALDGVSSAGSAAIGVF